MARKVIQTLTAFAALAGATGPAPEVEHVIIPSGAATPSGRRNVGRMRLAAHGSRLTGWDGNPSGSTGSLMRRERRERRKRRMRLRKLRGWR